MLVQIGRGRLPVSGLRLAGQRHHNLSSLIVTETYSVIRRNFHGTLETEYVDTIRELARKRYRATIIDRRLDGGSGEGKHPRSDPLNCGLRFIYQLSLKLFSAGRSRYMVQSARCRSVKRARLSKILLLEVVLRISLLVPQDPSAPE